MGITVDLTNPDQFQITKRQYLDVGVCPVTGVRSPGPLQPVELQLQLPGGKQALVSGKVIQVISDRLFLVEISEPPDFERFLRHPTDDLAGQTVTGRESEFSDLYRRIQSLSVSEKRKLARNGNRTARQLLIKESNKTLHMFVINNPKITLDEILEYSKLPQISREAIKLIAQNPSWTKSQQVVFNLTLNPSTPVDLAKRLIDRLTSSQCRVIANSNRVRVPVSAAAKKKIIGRM